MAVTMRMIACAVALAAASLGPAQAQQSQARTWCAISEVDGVSTMPSSEAWANMRRREFIAGLSGAVAMPLAARAQQAIPVVGFLQSGSRGATAHFEAAFGRGLAETGFVEGRNLAIEYRSAENQFDRLPALAADLVKHKVSAILATGNPLPAIAAKAATATIPIVFVYGGDPVGDGLVTSFNRPGGNVTGATFITAALGSKRLEQLRELVPGAGLVGVLINQTSQLGEIQWKDVQDAARSLGQQLHLARAGRVEEFDGAFASLAREGVGALLMTTDTMFYARRAELVALATRHRIPTSFTYRDYVTAGGLISYGADLADSYRQAGVYVGRILKGEKPGDLPVVRPTKFDLVVNLRTARALGLTIPESFLLRADEVID
jgi:putative ABC transport system substrate-binding protein